MSDNDEIPTPPSKQVGHKPKPKEPTKKQLQSANDDLVKHCDDKDAEIRELNDQLAASKAANAAAATAAAAGTSQQPAQRLVAPRPQFPVPRGRIDDVTAGDILYCIQRSDPKYTKLAAANKAYNAAQDYMHSLFGSVQIDKTLLWRHVKDTDKPLKLARLVKKQCPYMDCFIDDWAIRHWAKQYMSNSRQDKRNKAAALESVVDDVPSGDEEDLSPTRTRKRKRGVDIQDINAYAAE